MPTKPTVTVQSVTSQRDYRWPATVFDQHRSARFPKGRPWWGYLERPANSMRDAAFCTEMSPGDVEDPMGSVWNAPWFPEQMTKGGDNAQRSYFRLDTKRMTVTWLYPAIIADDTAALEAYYDDVAQKAYEKGWNAPAFGDPIGPQLRAIAGPAPRSPKIAQAALAGHPWLLGFTDQEDPELAELLRAVMRQRQPIIAPAVPSEDDMQAKIDAAVQKAVAAALEADRRAQKAVGDRLKAGRDKRKTEPVAATG